MIGTTIDALPVVEVDGKTIGDGRPGVVTKAARELLKRDQLENGTLLK